MPKNKGYLRPAVMALDYYLNLNDPGMFPFARGLYEGMYRSRKPTVRPFAGLGTAEDTNLRFQFLQKAGATGISTALDIVTLMGLDSDEEICEGQIGWDGVAVDTFDDMKDLYAGLPLDKLTASVTVNAPALAFLDMFIEAAGERGIPEHLLGGTLQNDILKEYAGAQNEWLYPPDFGVKLVADTIEYTSRFMPKWYPVSCGDYHIVEAGATLGQGTAFMVASALEFARQCVRRGMDPDEFLPKFSFFVNVNNEFAKNIARIRALRRVWARQAKENFNPRDQRSLWCRIHAQTSGVSLTRAEPLNNIARVTHQVLAALAGGVQSIHPNSYDEVLRTPTEDSVRVALQTLHILIEETDICDYPDVFGGAWQIEKLTDDVEEEAHELLKKIESMGGMLEAVKRGFPQEIIRASAALQDQRINSGDIAIVGQNKYVSETPAFERDFSAELARRRGFEESQKKRLAEFKNRRNGDKVKRALDEIRTAAGKDENMLMAMRRICPAACGATLGEISRAMQDVAGCYMEKDRGSVSRLTREMHKIAREHRLAMPLRVLIAKGGLDGHDRFINTLLAFLRELGAEVMFTGLHCGMRTVARRATQEDADVIGISTHVGNPLVHFERLQEYLREFGKRDATVIGGGIIRADELKELPRFGVKEFFRPDTDAFGNIAKFFREEAERRRNKILSVSASMPELMRFSRRLSQAAIFAVDMNPVAPKDAKIFRAHVVGVTGSAAIGKSTFIDKLVGCMRKAGNSVMVLAVDPSEAGSGGAVLGDVMRMRDHYADDHVFLRSQGSRDAKSAIPKSLPAMLRVAARIADYVVVETAGAGQGDAEIAEHVHTLIVLPETRQDENNLVKASLHHSAHILAVNVRNSADKEAVKIFRDLFYGDEICDDEWTPLVFEMNARDGDGVENIFTEGICAHRAFLSRMAGK